MKILKNDYKKLTSFIKNFGKKKTKLKSPPFWGNMLTLILEKNKKMFIKIFKSIRNKIYHSNDNDYYYGSFKGGISFWKLFLFNICYPGRLFNQLKFGQIKYFNYLKNKKG